MDGARPRAAVLWMIFGAALVVAALEVVWLVRLGRADTVQLWSDVFYGIVWIVSGLIAVKVGHEPHLGWLMTLLGWVVLLDAPAGFGHANTGAGGAAATLITLLLVGVQWPLIAHILLSYPRGRVSTPGARRLLITGYIVMPAVMIAMLVTYAPDPARCRKSCLSDAFAVVQDPGLYRTVTLLYDLSIAVLGLPVLIMLIHRIRVASPRERRVLGLAYGTAAGAAALVAANFLAAATGYTSGSGPDVMLLLGSYLGLVAVPFAFLLGLVRERLAYASVSDLVRSLDGQTPDQLEASLGHALGDPQLVVAFPMSNGQLIDVRGQHVAVPTDGSRVLTPVGTADRPALLLHDHTLTAEPRLLSAVGAAARLSLENARLHAEVRAQLAEVRASRQRIVSAGDITRRRLERDLHDGAQQRLLALGVSLGLLRHELQQRGDVSPLLDEAVSNLGDALAELRDLARGIYPLVLTEHGLAAAVADLSRRSPVPLTLVDHVKGRLPPAVEATAWFVVNEAVQNAVKHAAASRIEVRLVRDVRNLVIVVHDDGYGGAEIKPDGGLSGLVDRVAAADGNLAVDSPAGRGTRIEVHLPCE